MAKNPGGRPKKQMTLTDQQLQDIEDLYADGASDNEIKGHIAAITGSCSNDLWDRWLLEEPKFSETVKRGRKLSMLWWEREGRQALRDKNFNHVLWFMNMKNRFRKEWRDKQEIDIKVGDFATMAEKARKIANEREEK